MNRQLKTLLLSEANVKQVFEKNKEDALGIVEKALEMRTADKVILPDKSSQIFDEKIQNRINCMPGSLIGDNVSGVKWIAVFPENPKSGYENVTGTIILSELEHGHTISVMDASYLTGLRTAAVGATAVKYLSNESSAIIGFIGAGNEAMNHLDMICIARPSIKTCKVSSRSDTSVNRFIEIEKAKHPDIEFIACGNNYEKAVTGSDIIVTATSTQADLLKANWIKKGALYVHVGGWEDEYAVPQLANKIVCDEWECIKHRSQTISRMYKEGLLKDSDIYANLGDITAGKVRGRENKEEFIYFCSVGLAFIDVAFANYAYMKCRENGTGFEFQF
ncbi:ornithine cyclodeaminase family protein [uncultured Eubacterium sp.]|uniref:ornithine cyclodeaminase family protein n=1 Tax=uncultured Eubacterium sp. TaxID=165185 RepID=UPI002592B357|nr:ornithine cyclodeaminase family protein [uncultured Eubacterium sp.]